MEKLFSYRLILKNLTKEVKDKGLDPYEAYARFCEEQAKEGLWAEFYCSTAITSGGHARDDSLSMQEIIMRNNKSAMMLAEQLANDGQLNYKTTIEPVCVGKTSWNQAQYMEFWLSVIGGFTFDPNSMAKSVDNFRKSVNNSFESNELDTELIASDASAEIRAKEYFKMSTAFANLIKNGVPAIPIEIIIRMIDTELSLGAQTERAFARQIGSKVMNICIIKTATCEDLLTVNKSLSIDMARLIKFKSTIFDTSNKEVRLILSDDE